MVRGPGIGQPIWPRPESTSFSDQMLWGPRRGAKGEGAGWVPSDKRQAADSDKQHPLEEPG